jgi:hypothetical protein
MNSELAMGFAPFKEQFLSNLLSDRPSGKLVEWQSEGLINKFFYELERCVGVEQDSRFHEDDVFMHCVKTCDNVPPTTTLRWAALLHDIGKPSSIRKKDGKVTFYMHELESCHLSRNVLYRFGIKYDLLIEITDLVVLHMYNYTSNWTDRALLRFIVRSGLTRKNLEEPDTFPLFRLRIAERLSKGSEPVTQKQRDFENRLKTFFDVNYLLWKN